MNPLTQAAALIKHHEGLRLKPYRCAAGKLTIGYGRNLDDNGISKQEADYLLIDDLVQCREDLEQFAWWDELYSARKAALLDMRYNLGPNRFRGFELMLAALEAKDHDKVAEEMLNSRWANQVGSRAVRLADVMRTGIL